MLRLYGQFEVIMGHPDAGLAAAHRAIMLDPLNVQNYLFLSQNLRYARRYRDALTAYRHAVSLAPDVSEPPLVGALTYYALGDYGAMRVLCERLKDQVCLALTYHALAMQADAEASLAKLKAADGDNGAFDYAKIYAQWGDTSNALESLETAVHLGLSELYYLKAEPLLDPLRGQPRFAAIVRALKFPD
jgi:tetratricopeptide (TPR) repeat protein